jgi:hypothetical protein
VIIFLSFPQHKAMAPETLQQGAIGPKSSCTTGASSDAPPGKTQQQCRHYLVHHDAAIVAIEKIPQDVHLRIMLKTGIRKNKKQHGNGCDSIHISVDNGQLTI